MAAYSFGAGNARKLLSIPLYAAGICLGAIIPRSKTLWVFGCAVGVTDGALALWEVAHSRGESTVWLVANDGEAHAAAARGIPHVPRNSLRGFWGTLRAAVIVITHGFGDVNRYAVTGAEIVQLWHGIPLKKIGVDSPVTLRNSILPRSRLVTAVLGGMYRGATRRISLIPAASHLVRGRLESAFSLPDERVCVTGEPRVDVLSRGLPEQRYARAYRELERIVGPAQGRIVLYAPTWRDGDPDPAIPSPQQWTRIDEMLNRVDATLLIRSHPLGVGSYHPPESSTRIHALGSDLVADVTPLLPGIDVMITDYSSLLFDAGLVPMPVLFLAPDRDDYLARRGCYGSYQQITGGTEVRTWDELLGQLTSILTDPDVAARFREQSAHRSARFHDFRDGGNTERVYQAITVARARKQASGRKRARRRRSASTGSGGAQ